MSNPALIDTVSYSSVCPLLDRRPRQALARLTTLSFVHTLGDPL